ncbi:MAG: TetR family transcriptional regulator [Chloroflexi bacterium]|nr:TetR family transcriptional regulator [Chloroflexota bacterium]
MVHNFFSEWSQIQAYILKFEQEGLVTRTFRRLDPERQQVIVQAILDEAAEKGPTAINIKQVAERAGVAVGSLYQYFNNRDGLMAFSTALTVSLLTDAFGLFRPFLVEMPLKDALRSYLSGGMEWSQTMQGLIQFYGRAAYTGDPALAETVVRPVAVAMRETMFEMLTAAQARGELRQGLDLETAARAVNAWVIVLADSQMLPYLNTYFQISDETAPFDHVLESALSIIEKGLLE